MPPNNKQRQRAKAGSLRTWRQKMDLQGTVIAGSPKISSIVYCYMFPSCPGRVKIGYSSRGLARVAEQSTAFPEKPEVLFVIHHSRAKEIEAAFHLALADRQSDVMGTEWFDAGWPDLLNVSAILRRAAGARRRFFWLKWMVSFVLVAAGLALAPPLMAAISGLVKGLDAMRVCEGLKGYFEAIAEGDAASALETGDAMIRYAFNGDVSPLWPLAALAPLPVLGWLPWRHRRKQAC